MGDLKKQLESYKEAARYGGLCSKTVLILNVLYYNIISGSARSVMYACRRRETIIECTTGESHRRKINSSQILKSIII